jgi:ribonuclease HI
MNKYEIYTDGSCIHNANITGSAIGPGGYGIVILHNGNKIFQYANGDTQTTNNRMEIMGVLVAFQTLIENKKIDGNHYIIYSDSQYVINSLKIWLPGWVKKNFKDVKNVDLWKIILDQLKHFKGEFEYVWVKGHNGDKYNEIVNSIAQKKAYELKG